MPSWIRVDANRHQHPKFMLAGPWGSLVVEALWEISKCFDLGDTISPKFCTPIFIARWTMFDQEPDGAEKMQLGIDRAIGAGLLHRATAGALKIHGWDEYQRSESAERVAKHRNKTKQGALQTLHVTGRNETVTKCNYRTEQNRTEQNTTGQNTTEEASPKKQSSKKGSGSKRTADTTTKSGSTVQELLRRYYDLYSEHFGFPPQLQWNGQGRAVAKGLLEGPPVRTVDEVIELAGQYFELKDSQLEAEGYPFALFPYRINRILADRRPQRRLQLGDPTS